MISHPTWWYSPSRMRSTDWVSLIKVRDNKYLTRNTEANILCNSISPKIYCVPQYLYRTLFIPHHYNPPTPSSFKTKIVATSYTQETQNRSRPSKSRNHKKKARLSKLTQVPLGSYCFNRSYLASHHVYFRFNSITYGKIPETKSIPSTREATEVDVDFDEFTFSHAFTLVGSTAEFNGQLLFIKIPRDRALHQRTIPKIQRQLRFYDWLEATQTSTNRGKSRGHRSLHKFSTRPSSTAVAKNLISTRITKWDWLRITTRPRCLVATITPKHCHNSS
jgi:hypothetical protein